MKCNVSKYTIITMILLLCLNNTLLAQKNSKLITGKIINKHTKQPIQNVEIFISGTTIGTTTGKDGTFSIKSPYIPCHLGVTHVSYQSRVFTITSASHLNIELILNSRNINEVKVKGKNLRRKNLRLFYKYFMLNADREQIKILNDSVLKFKRSEYNFHAYCKSPLLIENRYLGYRIKVLIQDFSICKKQQPGGKNVKLKSISGEDSYKLSAFYFYENLPTKNALHIQNIALNRRGHYYGSLRHFLTSLYFKKLNSNGYLIKHHSDSTVAAFTLTYEERNLKRYKFNKDLLNVTYYYDNEQRPKQLPLTMGEYFYSNTTFMSLGKEFDVRPNGTSSNLSFEIRGDMGQRSLVNTLPNDYEPSFLISPR